MKHAFAAVLILAATAWPWTGSGSDWPMLAHDPTRSGATADEVRPPFERKWYRLFPDEGVQSGVQPIVADGKVYLGTLHGALHAMNEQTGSDIWVFRAGGPILHAAAAGGNGVYFGCADGCIYGVAAVDGTQLWKFQTGAAIWNAPAYYDTMVLIGGRDGNVFALRAEDGKAIWRTAVQAPALNSTAIDATKGRVYIGTEDMRVHALDLRTGRELWRSEPLPGASMRGYHPVIAPDGSVMVTTAPVIGYDRFQELLLEMAKEVFGDFASWRHNKQENDKWREDNLRRFKDPQTYLSQLAYLKRRLAAEPSFQTFFVFNPETGEHKFVAPLVASESMNGPAAPAVVTPDGRVIVKFQALLRSRYEAYSPFLNVGTLDTEKGSIAPLLDESRTYGWHDSLLLVHDEQSQLAVGGRILFNTHQDNVNAMDLETLQGYPFPLALNVHEPVSGEALAIRLRVLRGEPLPLGKEWLERGTAVYGGGSVLDTAIVIAGDSFYYLPTHELNSGCALIAYRSKAGAPKLERKPLTEDSMTALEFKKVQELPWDWDTLTHSRLTNLLAALPSSIPGTAAAPLWSEARGRVAEIPDAELDRLIWDESISALPPQDTTRNRAGLAAKLEAAVSELIGQTWRPLVVPAAKAPEEAYRFFTDPYETAYTLLLARPFLQEDLARKVDLCCSNTFETGIGWNYERNSGTAREAYRVEPRLMRVRDESTRSDLARLYPLWLWARTGDRTSFLSNHWARLRPLLKGGPSSPEIDCGNSRVAGLIAYCHLAKMVQDRAAVEGGLPVAREAMRRRLEYELAYTRGGLIRSVPVGRDALVRWHFLTPEVGNLIARYALEIERGLARDYVDHNRPGWWIAWNVEQLMRNEAPYQLPSTAMDIFAAKALILSTPATTLERWLDLPWCSADEFYIQKLALTLRAARSSEEAKGPPPKGDGP